METRTYEDALQEILSERATLQQELVDKQAERKSLQLDIADKKSALGKAKSRLAQLENEQKEKQIARDKALDQDALDIANTALVEHKQNIDSCITLVKNLTQYISNDSRYQTNQLLDDIKQIKRQLLVNHFDYLLNYFKAKCTDKDLELMKDFVVVNVLLEGSEYTTPLGYNIGNVFTKVHGQLMERDFSHHRDTMIKHLENTGDEQEES